MFQGWSSSRSRSILIIGSVLARSSASFIEANAKNKQSAQLAVITERTCGHQLFHLRQPVDIGEMVFLQLLDFRIFAVAVFAVWTFLQKPR